MPEQLPKGWVMTTLGEIVEPSRNRVLPAEVPAMPYVGLEHIQPQTMRLLGHETARAVRSSSVRFSKGDVLYGKMRPYLNKVWVAEFDGLCSAEFLVFPKYEGLNSQFLAARLNAEDFVSFANGQVSGERPRVGFEELSRFPVALPPSSEQDRIVEKLQGALTAVQRAETSGRRAHERLQRYRAAVTHAGVTGELTRAWRERNRKNKNAIAETGASLPHRLLEARRARWEESELKRLRASRKEPNDDNWKSYYPEPIEPTVGSLPELPDDWHWMSLDQLTHHLASGSRNWSKYYNRGTGTFLLAQNIRRSGLDLSFRQAVDPPADDSDRERSQVAKDDILVTIVGANTGDVCRVPYELPEHFVCQSVALIRLAEPLLSRFVCLYLVAEQDGQAQWRKMIYGAGRPHLAFKHLRTTNVPVPPLSEQREIVREVDRRLSAADILDVTLQEQLDRARETSRSLQREAFAGHLVPQNTRDEHASVLLRRIRDAREAGAFKQKGTPMVNPKPRIEAPGHRELLAVLKDKGGPMTPEELFRVSGHSQESVDEFFAELRELTTSPAKIVEERKAEGIMLLKALP